MPTTPRSKAKQRSSSRWGAKAIFKTRNRTAAKVRSLRAAFKTANGRPLTGRFGYPAFFKDRLGQGIGLHAVRRETARKLRAMRASGIVTGHRSAKQRMTSALNLRKARSSRSRRKGTR